MLTTRRLVKQYFRRPRSYLNLFFWSRRSLPLVMQELAVLRVGETNASCFPVRILNVSIMSPRIRIMQCCCPWPWSLALSCPRGQILSPWPWPWPWRSSPWPWPWGLSPWPWPWAKVLGLGQQVLGLAGLVISQTNNTATMLKSTFIAWMTLLCSTKL